MQGVPQSIYPTKHTLRMPEVHNCSLSVCGSACGSLSLCVSHNPFALHPQAHPDELASDPFVSFVYQMLLYLVKRVAEGSCSQGPLTPPTPTPFAIAVARSEKNGRGGMGFAGNEAGVSDGLVSGKGAGGGGLGHGRAAVRDASDLASLETSIAEGGGGRRCVRHILRQGRNLLCVFYVGRFPFGLLHVCIYIQVFPSEWHERSV